jgi:LuxR family transcriptional regulator, maltose regulon positive regulatory protein
MGEAMNLYRHSKIDHLPGHFHLLRAHILDDHSQWIASQWQPTLAASLKNPAQVEKEIQSLLVEGHYLECLKFLEKLPKSSYLDSSIFYVYKALVMTFAGFQTQEIYNLLSRTEVFDNNKNLCSEILAVKALMQSFSGDQENAIKLFHRAIAKIAPEKIFFRQLVERNLGIAYTINGDLRQAATWFECLLLSSHKLQDHNGTIAAYHYLTHIRMVQGRLQEAGVIYKKALKFIKDNTLEGYPHSIKIMAGYGHLWVEWHEVEKAKAYLRKAIRFAKQTDILLAQKAYQDLSEIFIREGDLHSALANIQECRQYLQTEKSCYFELINQHLLATEARIHLEAGRTGLASAWLKSSRFDGTPACDIYSVLGDQLGYQLPIAVRIYLAENQEEKALEILTATLPKLLHIGAKSYLIRGLNALAITYYQMDEVPKAHKALLKAIELAKQEGNLGAFIFIGPSLTPLLYEILKSGTETAFCGQLLTIFSNLSKGEPVSASLSRSIDPLSSRELDVLRLIARGMTNREIAGSLFLSANTIKSHSIKIYRKLNVNNRSQAVSKARLLGILPSKLYSPIQASI